jgi:hypothetical protein
MSGHQSLGAWFAGVVREIDAVELALGVRLQGGKDVRAGGPVQHTGFDHDAGPCSANQEVQALQGPPTRRAETERPHHIIQRLAACQVAPSESGRVVLGIQGCPVHPKLTRQPVQEAGMNGLRLQPSNPSLQDES